MTTPNTSIGQYMRTLIQEKGGDVDSPIKKFEAQGHIGLNYAMLIDFVETIAPADQVKVKSTLTQIDFKNGDVFHFLDYLVESMIKSMGMDAYV